MWKKCAVAMAPSKTWVEALTLLELMRDVGVQPVIVVTFTAAIKACGNGGQCEKDLDLLENVRDIGGCVPLYCSNQSMWQWRAMGEDREPAGKDE
ncbi:unnamed protein product [Discosporangium mesarthrocarpum]